jgi:hypothetical protein
MIDLEEIDLSAAPGTSGSQDPNWQEERCEDTCTRTKYSQLEAVTCIITS